MAAHKNSLHSQKSAALSKTVSKHGVYRRKEKYIKNIINTRKCKQHYEYPFCTAYLIVNYHSLYKTNPHIEDVPAIDEKIPKITMQGVGIFRGNQKSGSRLSEQPDV